MIRCDKITITTGATGAGTVLSTAPISGEVLSIRMIGAGLNSAGSTADYTFTRQADLGTVLTVSNVDTPWQYQPRESVHTTSGGTTQYGLSSSNVLTNGVPIDDYLQMVVAQAGSAVSGTAYVHYRYARR